MALTAPICVFSCYARLMAADPSVLIDRLHIRVSRCGHQDIDQDWNKFKGCCFPYWTSYINTSAGASIRLADGSEHELAPNLVHLIPAWVRYDCETTRKVQHLWALFDIVGIPGSLIRECFPGVRTLPLHGPLLSSSECMRQALTAKAQPTASNLFAVKSALYTTMWELFGNLSKEESKRLFAATAPDSVVAPALDLIDQRLSDPVSNFALARACGFSEHHFIRLFRRHLGQSPAQYALERRVAEGARLLALEEHGIDEISRLCGFPDRYYFTRVFSRLMGLAPAAYRRMK